MILKEIDFSDINEFDLKDWNFVLDNSMSSTIFQTPEWIQLSLKWSNAKGKIILAYREKIPVGCYFYYLKDAKYIFKKSSTGIFESPYGGPIVIDGEEEQTIDLMIKRLQRNLLLSSITVIVPPFVDISPFVRSGFKNVDKATMVLKLNETEEILFEQMHKMKRRNIRKAIKNNIVIVHENSSSLDTYHSMLVSTYKRLNLSPPKPIEYYKDVFQNLEPNNRIILSIAYLDEQPIACGLFLVYNGTVIFWQGASYQEYMKFGANDLIHWNIIQFAKSAGLSYYNLLHFHDEKGVELESLKRFKEGFGSKSTAYHLLVKKSMSSI